MPENEELAMETIELQNELRAFYEKEDRKRRAREWVLLVGAWVLAGSGAVWLCTIALHWSW